MVSNQMQVEERQRLAAVEFFEDAERFNFDAWAVAVRRQMLASLKKRETGRPH